jgi:hypothetical protein
MTGRLGWIINSLQTATPPNRPFAESQTVQKGMVRCRSVPAAKVKHRHYEPPMVSDAADHS